MEQIQVQCINYLHLYSRAAEEPEQKEERSERRWIVVRLDDSCVSSSGD